MDKLIVGKIIKLHGIKGAVKIVPVIDDNVNFEDLEGVYIDYDGVFQEFEEVFAVSDVIGVKFKNINNVDDAQKIIGKFIYADKEKMQSLVDDESFFIEDLKGSVVTFENGDSIGVIDEIDNFGSADIFYIKSEKYKNLSLPHVAGLVSKFDEIEKKLIIFKSKFEEVAVYDD